MILDLLRVLFTPSCWIQNKQYSKEWDNDLKQLMSKHQFTDRAKYTAKLGDFEVWIGNHPYASFRPEGCDVRASRITILKAADKLARDCPIDTAPWRKQMETHS